MLDWRRACARGPRPSGQNFALALGASLDRLLSPARRGLTALYLVGTLLLAAWLALGPVVPDAARAQEPADRKVFTYFYYWYEPLVDDPRSIDEHASLTNHFPPNRDPDWRSADWYKGQLTDMQKAGIDVALMVYWGDHLYPETSWSTEGLDPLVQALDSLADSGKPYPRIGLFLDTYVLDGADLTDPDRIDWLAGQIRAFYRRLPERHRATQDGRPFIWIYVSNFANGFDQSLLNQLSDRLEGVVAARPIWVADSSWLIATSTGWDGQRHSEPRQPMPFDGYYRWGAASRGAYFVDIPIPIASVGPGYDDTAIIWRGDERSSRSREGGCLYARGWRKAQSVGARWVTIETWDELYEGTGIAETSEWGRFYIDATQKFSAAFKQNTPIALPQGCPDIPIPDDDDSPPPDPGTPQVAPATGNPGPSKPPLCPPLVKKKRPDKPTNPAGSC